MLIDTHCHIHESSYPLEVDDVLQRARDADVTKMICVGTTIESSREALAFAATYDQAYASIGVHPHDAKDGWAGLAGLVVGPVIESAPDFHPVTDAKSGAAPRDAIRDRQVGAKLVAIGEIGLDYFYTHSSRDVQIEALQAQIELALAHDLPIIFHVREAFDDFWPIFDNFHGIRGELHSFTDTMRHAEEGMKRGLLIGVNGISTFTKDPAQQETFAHIPLDNLLQETDAPFLTPMPFRGKVNEPAFVKQVAEHHAKIRGLSFDEIATVTTANAHALFAL